MKKLLLILMLVLLSPAVCFGAPDCTYVPSTIPSGPAYYCLAESCSAAHINAAITAVDAAGGGSAYMPACDYQSGSPNGALWSSGTLCLQGANDVRLFGQGIDSTKIGIASGWTTGGGCTGMSSCIHNAPILIGGGAKTKGPKEIAHFYIDLQHNLGVEAIFQHQCGSVSYPNMDCTTGNETTNFVYHHLYIKDAGSGGGGRYVVFFYNPASTTVIHSSTLYNSNVASHSGQYGFVPLAGFTTGGTNGWIFPPQYGTNMTTGVFIEGNTIDGTYHPFDAFYSTNIVFRYNTIRNVTSGTSGHEAGYYETGCQPADPAGPNLTEIYRNDSSANYGGGTFAPFYMRNGFYIVTKNYLHDTAASNLVDILNTGVQTGRDNCTTANDCPTDYIGYSSTENCYQVQHGWIWDSVGSPTSISYAQYCSRVDEEVFTRAPTSGDWGYNGAWTPYDCPHPLAGSGTCSETTAGTGGYILTGGTTTTPPSANGCTIQGGNYPK